MGGEPEKKVCPRCEEEKEIEEFGHHAINGRQCYCRPCNSEQRSFRWRTDHDYRKRHEDKERERLYGVTPEQHKATLEKQGNRCAICGESPKEGSKLHTDHWHLNRLFRGLLCNPCNLMLGHMRDNPRIGLMAVDYLEKARSEARRQGLPIE